MATTIKLKNGSGAPLAGDLVQGEPALDLTNKRLYTEDSGGTVIEVGTNPSTLTVTGDLAVDTDTLFADASEDKVAINDATGRNSTLHVNSATLSASIGLSASGTTTKDNQALVCSGDDLFFTTGATERMRINSSGTVILKGPDDNALQFYESGSEIARVGPNSGNLNFLVGTTTTPRMTIDSSGNVGIGTASPSDLLSLSSASPAILMTDADTSDTFRLKQTNTLSEIQASTDFAIDTAGTERMRIDSNGNVGIGTTSPQYKLEVSSSSYGIGFSSSFTSTPATITFTNGGNRTSTIRAEDFGSSLVLSADTQSGNSATKIAFETDGSERMRIDASGNLLVGTTTPNSALSVALGSTTLPAAGASTSCAMFSNSVSGGLYGTQIGALSSGVGYIQVQRADGVAGTYDLLVQPNGGEVRIAGTTDRGNYKLQVNTTGVWGQGSYVNGSDARWKDNVQTLDCNCLDIVNNLRSVSYTYNEDSGASDLTTPHLGFIAQEVEQATGDHPWLSGLVTEDSEGYKSMAYQELIPVLTKAIQEQQAMIETLQAEVAALKGA